MKYEEFLAVSKGDTVLLALLSELKDIEASGLYRLIKTKEGRWAFQAPDVQLEDEI